VLRGLVETKPGEPLDMAKLGDDMRRIYGRDDFEGIGYSIGGQAGPARAHDRAARKIVGSGLPPLRPRARERLPGRQPVQLPGRVPQAPGSTGWAANG
jgi:hypothetical protein